MQLVRKEALLTACVQIRGPREDTSYTHRSQEARYDMRSRDRNNRPQNQSDARSRTPTGTQASQAQDEELADLKDDLRRSQERNHKLHEMVRKAKGSDRKSRQDLGELQEEHQALQNNIEYLNDKLLRPYASKTGINWDNYTREELDRVLDKFLSDAVDAENLRRQLRAYQDGQLQSHNIKTQMQALEDQVQMLQKELFARVKKAQATSDEQFAKAFRILASSIKSLSRTMRFDPAKDITEMLIPTVLLLNVPKHHWQDRAGKKWYVEIWIWCVLLEKVFCNPFALFGSHSKSLSTAWIQVYGTDHSNSWPQPTIPCELWRYTTVEGMTESVGRAVIVHGKTDEPDQGLEASVVEARIVVASMIEVLLEMACTKSDFSQLQQIVDHAFELALEMSLQKSRVQITHPKIGADFSEHDMVLTPDQDGEEILEGTVAIVINPGLTKWGDATGKNLDQRYDIVPALVHLEAKTPAIKEPDMCKPEVSQEAHHQRCSDGVETETVVVEPEIKVEGG